MTAHTRGSRQLQTDLMLRAGTNLSNDGSYERFVTFGDSVHARADARESANQVGGRR
jgi:hypothetical protein